MNYVIYPASILLYFLLCYLVGKLAKNKALGFDQGFLLSLCLSPLVGVILAVTGARITARTLWWKLVAIALVVYALVGGLLLPVPTLPILNETIRNLYFHVPMWFAMIGVFLISVYYSINYLSSGDIHHDMIARAAVWTGMVLGALGLITGMVWANFTWGAPWVNDPKLNGAAISMLIYTAYLILREALPEESKRGQLSAVYNIFAFSLLIVFLFILPRMYDSLHPGNGGNPAFSLYDNQDLDSSMRMVFYPAVIGWGLLGVWIMTLQVRLLRIQHKLREDRLDADTEYDFPASSPAKETHS